MTRRQQLIQQTRSLLGILQKPNLEDLETDIVFVVADTEFNFTLEQLNEDLGCSAS